MRDRLDSLTNINLDDLVAALGLRDGPRAGRVARRLLKGPAQTFARHMLEFDSVTGDRGIAEGARHAERRLAKDVRVFGGEKLPKDGFLALSNHPGLTDTLALFSALNRVDVRTIAFERPFLANLVQVSTHLFYLSEAPAARVKPVREVARALRAGATVLTFPAGHIEPDPDVFPGAVASLATWTQSAEVFIRLAPGIPVVPVCVRGVTWRAMAWNPLTRLRRSPEDRQLLASALQLLWQLTFRTRPVTVRVQFGDPIRLEDGRRLGVERLHRAVVDTMTHLIQNPPAGHGQSAL